MKHKKPKRASNKKNKTKSSSLSSSSSRKNNEDVSSSTSNNKKGPSVDELIEAGEAAAAAMETDKALAFFASAEAILKSNSNQQPHPQDEALVEKQVYVLEQLGETKASIGDVDAAKQDFQNAIALLLLSSSSSSSNRDQDPCYQESLAGLHLYVGQLSSEHEALEAYKKGLSCLERSVQIRQHECINNGEEQLPQTTGATTDTMEVEMDLEVDDTTASSKNGNESPKAMLNEARQKLASACATIAELYLTDLCFEENAETECESYVMMALKICSEDDGEPFVDALQTAASLRLSQQRKKEARQYILRAYNQKMKAACEALAKLVGLDDAKSKRSVELLKVEVDAANNLPSFEFRCQTAKLLLECAAKDDDDDDDKKSSPATTSSSKGKEDDQQERMICYKASVHVLGSLLAENDEVPEVWYLLGCAYKGSENDELARHYWSRALEMLSDFRKELEKEAEEGEMHNNNNGDDDDDDENEELDMQIQSISCQIEEIRSKLEDLEEEGNDDDNTKMEE